MNSYFDYVRVKEARPIQNCCLEITFQDGSRGVFDCTPYLKDPYWKSLAEPAVFRQVRVDGGILSWPNDIDIAPEEVWHNTSKEA